MEEQLTTPSPAARTSRTVPLLVLLVLIAAAVVGAYVVISRRGAAPDLAGFIPRNAAVAMTLDLTQTPEKLAAYDFVNGLFKEAGQDKALDTLFQEISKGLKLDFKKDVVAHLNGKVAGAVLDEMATMPMPKMVAVIGAKSSADADAIMTTLGNKLNVEKVGFTRGSYGNVNYYNIPMPSEGPSSMMPGLRVVSYIGAVKSTIVYANSELAFKKVVDTANGKPSLLSDKNYTTLRKSGPKVFATTYMSGPSIYKLLEPVLQLASMQAPPGSLDGTKQQMEAMLAAVGTAEASGDGIKYSMATATSKKQVSCKPVPIDEMVAGVPKDATVVMSLGNFATMWSVAVAEMGNQPLQKSQFDQVVLQVKAALGIDLRTDVLDRIKSFQAYYVPRKAADSANFPGFIDIVMRVDKPEVVAQMVQKLHGMAASLGGMPFKPMSIAGQKAFVAPLGSDGDTLTDAIIGDRVLFHIGGKGGMPAAIARLKNPGVGIETGDTFKLVKSLLSPDSNCLFYSDFGAIVRMFSDEMSPEDRKIAESITRKVGAIGLSAMQVDGREETQLVIPFVK